MKVHVVGAGAREHTLAWKLDSEGHSVGVSPGNGGTAAWQVRLEEAEMVVIGPEAPLAEGLADRLAQRWVFGPSQRAAEIETSKAFAKDFMSRHGIPTAAYHLCDASEAPRRIRDFPEPPVLKESGLAAGKGVLVPSSWQEAEGWVRERTGPMVLEERLVGEELSLLAFCDGQSWTAMPGARDYKRLLDGDAGPNTGGMGAYCDGIAYPELARAVIEPAVRGLAEEGRPFRGVLYAGVMLTERGPRVLEYNCRFGDPETEVLLPLLASPLGELLQACCEGRLSETRAVWKEASAVCVVVASRGYPGKPEVGHPLALGSHVPDTLVFHAGTRREGEALLSAGGRVLVVTGVGATRPEARERAYRRVASIELAGSFFRRDVARSVEET